MPVGLLFLGLDGPVQETVFLSPRLGECRTGSGRPGLLVAIRLYNLDAYSYFCALRRESLCPQARDLVANGTPGAFF